MAFLHPTVELNQCNQRLSVFRAYPLVLFILCVCVCASCQIHKPITISTSPFRRGTHWRQTVFYLSEQLTVERGERIEGQIACEPNKKNPRDLNITIRYSFDGKHMKAQSSRLYNMR